MFQYKLQLYQHNSFRIKQTFCENINYYNIQALESGSSEQRRRISRRIEVRRREKMSSEFEVHQAAGMMMLAQRRMHQREQHDKMQHNKQQHMV